MQALLDLIELPTVVLREHCPGLRPEDVRRALSGEAAAAAFFPSSCSCPLSPTPS